MNKNKCIQELVIGSKVKKQDLEVMEKRKQLDSGKVTYYNLDISHNGDVSLGVQSMTFKSPAMQYIRSITKQSRTDLWKEIKTR